MNVLIVTGLSGAGKTRTLQILEDMGYYCMDNISPRILLPLVQGEMKEEGFSGRMAVTMDIRSYGITSGLDPIAEQLRESSIGVRILFLDCSQQVLLKRYKETRRLHPLMGANPDMSLTEAICEEIRRMDGLKNEADYVIDTSELSTSGLREKLAALFSGTEEKGMRIEFVAFGYKYGILADADLVFDVRCVANPYYVKELRGKTGEDKEVRDFVMSHAEAKELFNRIAGYLEFAIPLYEKEGKAQLVVGLGCTGGQHRSVTYASLLKEHFAAIYPKVRLRMRDMEKNKRTVTGEGRP